MSSLEQQPGRRFCVDDQPICPQCGNPMHLTGRDSHSEYSAHNYEGQTFICYVCRYESLHSPDASGNQYD